MVFMLVVNLAMVMELQTKIEIHAVVCISTFKNKSCSSIVSALHCKCETVTILVFSWVSLPAVLMLLL